MDTQLRSTHIRVERKYFTFDLKENLQGTFLRITEEVNSGRRNSIVIPATGLELFRDSLNEVLRFEKSPAVASEAVLSLGQPKTGAHPPDRSADLKTGS